MTERLSSPVTTSEALLRQSERGGWEGDSIQTSQSAVSLLRVIQVMGAVAIIASSYTRAKGLWVVDPRTEVATSPTIRSLQRPRLTAKEARTLALSSYRQHLMLLLPILRPTTTKAIRSFQVSATSGYVQRLGFSIPSILPEV